MVEFSAEELASEEWRPVLGAALFDGQPRYEVSSLGRVRSHVFKGRRRPEPKLLKFCNQSGYTVVAVKYGEEFRLRRVHQLVLESFVGPRGDGQIGLHHPDPTRSNNRLANLRWGSYADNTNDALSFGTPFLHPRRPSRRRRGCANASAKFTDASVALARWLHIEHGVSYSDIGRWFGVANQVARAAVIGRTWSHVPYGLEGC